MPRENSGYSRAKNNQSVRSLLELRGKRVGIVAGSVPLSPRDHVVVGFPSQKALIEGFQRAELDGALVDVDFCNWYLRQHPGFGLRLVEAFVSTHRWNIGIAVRAKDASLRDELSRAINTCLQKAEFRSLFSENGLVYLPPLVERAGKPNEIIHDTWKRIKESGSLRVSMDPADLPYSSADPDRPGFDVEIARAVAKEMEVELKIDWIDVHSETAIGSLLEDECDLAFGAAIDPQAMDDEEELTGKVLYSRPYYGTGYVLITRRDGEKVKSLSELKGEKSRRIGTQAGTVADYSLRQDGYFRRLFGTQLSTLSALDKKAIDYAYLWSNVGWLLHASPETNATLVESFVPEQRWNIAVAMRSGDTTLSEHVNHALDRVVRQGLVKSALQKYYVPYFPPFDEKPNAGKEVSQHSALDRGPEPLMSHRQRSRQSYDGLARIRSRGSLIVGLDQNNLPFSTAHPLASGLDYEVAELLANELGVSLEVYWAYSSHDSYPSKLANKKLCDVILGVMPDDRFGEKVAYSEPYYHASYVYAVPHDAISASIETGAIAAEPGIAVHGLAGRKVESYPNLETILAAVAQRKAPIGYVISSRALWIAENEYPGKLRFVSPGNDIDRFAICAAVRRDEPDLKSAIDDAFRDLRDTGQLQEVFAKWHVPLEK